VALLDIFIMRLGVLCVKYGRRTRVSCVVKRAFKLMMMSTSSPVLSMSV